LKAIGKVLASGLVGGGISGVRKIDAITEKGPLLAMNSLGGNASAQTDTAATTPAVPETTEATALRRKRSATSGLSGTLGINA
jgi:hypothetical protein